jgi:hypothetical protein
MKTSNKIGFYAQDRDMLKGMLVVNSLRGAHSTGIAGVCSRRESDKEAMGLVKAVQSPYYLFDHHKTDEFFRRFLSDYDTIIGHGRYATRGEINADNAHPFEEGHITLVHNGGISNFYQLRDTNLDKEVEVDSHLVARLIERNGWEETLPKLRGAYALVWYDSRDGSLHFARNKERPMVIAKLEKKDTIIYASEAATLEWAASRYGYKIESLSETHPFTHYEFPKGSIDFTEKVYKEVFTVAATGGIPFGDDKTLTRKERRRLAAQQKHQGNKNPTYLIGAEVEMEVLDTFAIKKDAVGGLDRVLVKCESEFYPDVEFRFTIDAEEEEEYIRADSIVGVIKAVMGANAQETINKVPWVAWVVDHNTVKEDSFVMIDHFMDGPIRIPRYKAVEMISKGCDWCEKPIPAHKINHLNHMMLYDNDMDDCIICETCVRNYSEMPNWMN